MTAGRAASSANRKAPCATGGRLVVLSFQLCVCRLLQGEEERHQIFLLLRHQVELLDQVEVLHRVLESQASPVMEIGGESWWGRGGCTWGPIQNRAAPIPCCYLGRSRFGGIGSGCFGSCGFGMTGFGSTGFGTVGGGVAGLSGGFILSPSEKGARHWAHRKA